MVLASSSCPNKRKRWYLLSAFSGDSLIFADVKKDVVQHRGESLISVPYWWDGTEESLVATIKSQRPDLLPLYLTTKQPIPVHPPQFYLPSVKSNILW